MTKNTKTLLVDADVLMFEAAHKADKPFFFYPEVQHITFGKKEMQKFCKDNDLDPDLIEEKYKPQDFSVCVDCLEGRRKEILEHFNNEPRFLALLTGRNNFRYKISTISGYKANRRKQHKPHHLQACRDYIIENWDHQIAEGQEADDLAGILQDDTTCALSTDKDWNTFPGLHGMWTTPWNKEFKTWEVDDITSLKNFYTQLITGDTSDNILGLYGIGKTSVYVKRLQTLETEEEMFRLVYQLYYERFRNYAVPFLLETGRLLWIRREPDQMWEFPKGVYEKLEGE